MDSIFTVAASVSTAGRDAAKVGGHKLVQHLATKAASGAGKNLGEGAAGSVARRLSTISTASTESTLSSVSSTSTESISSSLSGAGRASLRRGASTLARASIRAGVTEAGEAAGQLAAMGAVEEGVKNAGKYSLGGAAAGVGVGVVIEAGFTLHRYNKYKKDDNYTWTDFKYDTGKSWAVAAICTGIGIALMPIGWMAILPTVGAAIIFSSILSRVDSGKTRKEKIYIDCGLSGESSVEDLKEVRRKIRKELLDKKLHPDKWPADLKDEDKPKRLEKFLFRAALLGMIAKDIERGYVSFKEEDVNGAQKMLSGPTK